MSDERRPRLEQSLGALLDLPKDIVLNLPKVTLLGNIQFYMENHQGILRYQTEQVVLKCHGGNVIVEGKNLTITSLSAEDIYLEGDIRQVRYEI